MTTRSSIRTPLALCLASASALFTGCSQSVIDSAPVSGASTSISARDKGFSIPSDSYNSLGYRLDWRGFPAVSPGEHISALNIYPDALLVQESGSTVTVMEPANGTVRWRNELASRLTKFAGMSRTTDIRYGDVFTVASQSEVYLLATQTGTLVARQGFEKVVNAGTVNVGNAGLYGTATGELLFHQYSNGIKLWGVDAAGSYDFPPVLVSGAIAGAVTSTGRVLFVDMGAGRLIGGGQIYGGPGALPASNGTEFFVASLDQSLYAFSPTGQQIWRRRTASPLTYKPLATPEAVYCTTQEGFTSFDAATGASLWTAKDVSGEVIGKRKTNLMVWNGKTMFLVDQQRGDVLAKENLPDVRIIKTSAFEDGDLYVASTSGVLAKFVTH